MAITGEVANIANVLLLYYYISQSNRCYYTPVLYYMNLIITVYSQLVKSL